MSPVGFDYCLIGAMSAQATGLIIHDCQKFKEIKPEMKTELSIIT
jgi:hypothetical protein